MAADTWLRSRVTKLMLRVDAIEAKPDLSAEVAELQAWRAAMEGEVEPPVDPPVEPGKGFQDFNQFTIDKGLTYNWDRFEIIMANWHNGVKLLSDPSLVTWHADGSVTLDAEAIPGGTGDNQWRMGSFKYNRPKKAKGRCGAVVHVTDPSAVAAFFGYERAGGKVKEVDFELTLAGGVAAWAPNVHLTDPATGQTVSAADKRLMRRAPLADRQQTLEWDWREDRCDFYCDGEIFETIWESEFAEGSWNMTLGMGLICSVEQHGGWAGWDYASGKAQMKVYKLDPGPDAILPPTREPLPLPVLDDNTVNPAPATIDGIAWTFPNATGSSGGILSDGKTILLKGPDKAQAVGNAATVAGKRYRLSFGVTGYLSMTFPGQGWGGFSVGTYAREFTATGTGMQIKAIGERATSSYLSGVKVEALDDEPVEPDEPVDPPVDPVTVTKSLAIGLEGVTDWDTSTPFINELKSARDWTGHSGRQGTWGDIPRAVIEAVKDADGHLTRMPDGAQSVELLTFVDMKAELAPIIGGRYRLRWTGTGDVRVAGQSAGATGEHWFDYQPRGGMLAIAVHGTDSSNPVKLQSLVREDRVAAFDAGEVFKPEYIAQFAEAGAFRFMDWGKINTFGEGRNRTLSWASRPKPSSLIYTGPQGVPVEIMCDLCNRISADGRFNIPHGVSDDYIDGYAKLVKARLRKDLVCSVAYSNEVWNFMFGQARWAQERGAARWPNLSEFEQNQQFYGTEVARMGRIFRGVFAGEGHRLDVALETHPSNPWAAEQSLLTPAASSERPLGIVNSLSTTGYYGHSLADGAAAQQLSVIDRNQGMAAAVTWGVQYLDNAANSLTQSLAGYRALCDKYKLTLDIYEGGPHANLMGQWHNNARQLELMKAIHEDPRAAQTYTKVLNIARQAGVRWFFWFVATGRWTKDGFWGLDQYLGQNSAGWRALTAWARANPHQVA